ncbi:hypothetical protein ABZ749_27850, partial [Micromonospora sp. NPDC047753]|uniref:hypothetical protein n=1 Tax=Micromonospora sp. NPDC047753 TaxID=3154817 RepID=UPI0033ED1099
MPKRHIDNRKCKIGGRGRGRGRGRERGREREREVRGARVLFVLAWTMAMRPPALLVVAGI